MTVISLIKIITVTQEDILVHQAGEKMLFLRDKKVSISVLDYSEFIPVLPSLPSKFPGSTPSNVLSNFNRSGRNLNSSLGIKICFEALQLQEIKDLF